MNLDTGTAELMAMVDRDGITAETLDFAAVPKDMHGAAAQFEVPIKVIESSVKAEAAANTPKKRAALGMLIATGLAEGGADARTLVATLAHPDVMDTMGLSLDRLDRAEVRMRQLVDSNASKSLDGLRILKALSKEGFSLTEILVTSRSLEVRHPGTSWAQNDLHQTLFSVGPEELVSAALVGADVRARVPGPDVGRIKQQLMTDMMMMGTQVSNHRNHQDFKDLTGVLNDPATAGPSEVKTKVDSLGLAITPDVAAPIIASGMPIADILAGLARSTTPYGGVSGHRPPPPATAVLSSGSASSPVRSTFPPPPPPPSGLGAPFGAPPPMAAASPTVLSSVRAAVPLPPVSGAIRDHDAGVMSINIDPEWGDGSNIAHLPDDTVVGPDGLPIGVSTEVQGEGVLVFDREKTNGDGSCGLHALFAVTRNDKNEWSLDDNERSLENAMKARREINEAVQKLGTADQDLGTGTEELVRSLVEKIVATRVGFIGGVPPTPIFEEINTSYFGHLAHGHDFSYEQRLEMTKEIFSKIIGAKSGGEHEEEGQITPDELKLIAVLKGVNVLILSAPREDSVKTMNVWRSQPDNLGPRITVVHSGGVHWERWQQRPTGAL
jgi:hypothetical protein